MIYVSGGRRGFYSNVLWYLNNCNRAEILSDNIEFNDFSTNYCDDPSKGFYDFFQRYELNNNLKYDYDINIKDIENIRYFKNTEICGFILDFDIRKYINFLIYKYLKINENIKNKINLNLKNFKDKKVLGVHIRQTDLYRSHIDNKLDKPLKIQDYLKEIENNISNYDMLYLMSDNYQSIEIVKNYFKDFPIYFIKDIIRSNNILDNPIFRNNNNKSTDKYKLGEDIIIETELLSKCDKIIITNSNISSYCLVNNLNIEFKYLDLKIDSNFFENYKKIMKYGI
jgi:hypothetical protein